MAALLALLSSAIWGTSDFLGGTLSRRLDSLTVVGVSQAFALVALLPLAAVLGGFSADPAYLPWAVAAGIVGLVGLRAFYQALATGTMGVVAPVAALGVVVPVGVGLAQGESPGPIQLAGLAVAAVGVVLASGPELSERSTARPVALAAVAAVGFGLVIVFVAKGSHHDVVMTLLVMRATTVLPLLAVVAARRRLEAALSRARPDWRLLALTGLGDVAANGAYGVASRGGLLSLVAVLSSLYPVVTVLLARAVHQEALRPVQAVGVGAAVAGVVLIGAGGGVG